MLPRPPVAAQGIALFLDLDGVLAPMAPTPDEVGPVARRTAVLKAVQDRLDGRVAVVSGRTIREIDRITDRALESASGVHGLERRLKGGPVQRTTADAAVARALDAFHAFAADRQGVIVEDKGVSAGLHYRLAPDQGAAALVKDGQPVAGIVAMFAANLIEDSDGFGGAREHGQLVGQAAEIQFHHDGIVPLLDQKPPPALCTKPPIRCGISQT